MLQYKMVKYKEPEQGIIPPIINFDTEVNILLCDGWQFFGDLIIKEVDGKLCFIRELVKEIKEGEKIEMTADEFNRRFNSMDSELKDLLTVNNINLFYWDGEFYTSTKDSQINGINPITIINLLKNSEHVPLNLDEDKVVKEIEKLIQ